PQRRPYFALKLETEVLVASTHVRFGPKADMALLLFDHFIRDGDYPWRHLDAEHSRRLEVDDELEFGRLQHRQVGGCGSFEDATGRDGDLTKGIPDVGSVAHQPTGCRMNTQGISRRNPVMGRQGSKLYGAADKKCVAADEERIGALARKCGKGRIDLSDRAGIEDLELQAEGRGGFLRAPQCSVRDC